MKSRSASACVKAGLQLYLSKFRRIFRQTWLVALLYAVAATVSGMICINLLPSLILTSSNGTDDMIIGWLVSILPVTLGCGLLSIVAITLLLGYGMSLLWQHATQGTILVQTGWLTFDRKTVGRTAVAMICLIVLSLITSAVLNTLAIGSMISLGTKAGLAIAIALIILTIVFWLPMDYIMMKYVLGRQGGFFHTLRKSYSTGLRHWGLIFVVLLITGITAMLVVLIANLPAFVLTTANVEAYQGAMTGDPLGMPSHNTLLTAITLFLTGFIQAYILLMTLFPSYYMYGSIEKQEDERAEAIQAIERREE